MRIGLDGFPLMMPRTGVGHYTFELARALSLLFPADHFQLISPGAVAPSVLEELERDAPSNLQVVKARASGLRRHWWAIGLPLYLRQSGIDLFHGTNYEAPLWNKRRTVLTIHDLSILLHADKHEDHLVRRARRRLPLMARSSSRIITDSESIKREICEHLRVRPDRISVVPAAPRSSFRPLPFEQTIETRRRLGVEDEFILFVGTIEPRKNLITLARAFEQVMRRSERRPQLVLAGQKGWLANELYSFIERAGINERLLFTGYVSDEDLRALYSSCRIFVYPSLYEGFGLPPLEAMACGAPVITSRIPVLVETVGEAARLFDPVDASALAQIIVELLEDERARQHLSEAGKRRAASFTWERTARLTMDVYLEVLRRA